MSTHKNLMQVIVLAVLAGFVFSGCGKKELETGKVKLVLVDALYGKWIELNNKIIKEFEKEYPNIEVELISAPDYPQKVQTMITGGEPPDITYFQIEEFRPFAIRGVLMDLNEFIRKDKEFNPKDYYSFMIEDSKYENKIYWMPAYFSPVALFYNKTLFDEAGLEYPNDKWTWKEFLTAAKKLTKDKDGDGRTDQFGFGGGLWNTHRWPIMVWQNGGEIFNKDGTKCVMDSKEAVESIQFCYDLEHKYNVAPKIEEGEQAKGQDINQMFSSGRIAMFFTTRYYVPVLRQTKDFQWDVAPVFHQKRRSTCYVAGGYSILKGSKHPEEAWKFVKFLVGKTGARLSAEAGRALPALKSIVEEAVIHPGIPPENDKVFIELAKYSRSAPDMMIGGDVLSKLNMQFEYMRIGKLTPEELCKKFTEIANTSLKK